MVAAHEASGRQSRVAVIIPVFNDQAGIDACIAALEQQSYASALLDVIVVDNGSDVPIRLPELCSLQARVITCESPGAYAARNAGIAVADADVLAFTDADCVPAADWIEKGVAALEAGNRRRIVGGEVAMRLSARPTAVELYQVVTGFAQRGNIESRGFTVTANLFVGRDSLDTIGLFDTGLLSGGDREWSRRALSAGYELVYAGDAVVETSPRRTLRDAARQARRVAGGRKALQSGGIKSAADGDVSQRRGAIASTLWILRHPELGWRDRLRVFTVAVVLYAVQIVEVARLAIGRPPERR